MAWNYKHCTPTGGGFNDGSSKDNAWTLSQMIANYAAGDWVWMYHDGTGFDTAATQYIFATSGTDAANVMFAGCGTVAGDGERCKISNPGGTQYSGMLRTNGSYLNFQNLWISKKDLNEAITITGRRNSFRNCIFESTQTTTGHPVNGSGNAMMFDGCVFVSAGYSTVASISNSAVLSNCVFLSLGALSTTQIFLGTFRDYTISNCLFIAPTAITGSDAITLVGTQFSQNDNIAIIRNSFYGMDNGIDFNPTATDSGRLGFLTFHGNVMDVQSYGIRNQGAATYAGGLSILGNAIKAGTAATDIGDVVDDTIILTESPFTDPDNYDLTLNRVAGGGLECIRGYIGAEARSTFNIPVDFNIGSAPEFNIIKAANEVRPDALVGHWSASLDDDGAGTTAATDLSGNGHNGTKNGGLTEVSDPSFNGVRAWDMDGTGDYITVADDDAFTFVSGGVDQPFTISTWVRFNAVNSGVVDGVVTKGDAADTGEWQITKFGTDLYWRTTDQSGGVYFGIGIFTAITIGKWTHLVCTYDGRTGNADAYKIYLDGVEVPADATSSNGTPSAMQNTTHPVLIGRRGTGTELDGQVDDTRIYNALLSVDEIQALAANRVGREPLTDQNWKDVLDGLVGWMDGLCYDTSANDTFDRIQGIEFSGQNGAKSRIGGNVGKAISLVGTGRFITSSTNGAKLYPTTNDESYYCCGWYLVRSGASDNNNAGLFHACDGTDDRIFWVEYSGSGNVPRVDVSIDGTATTATATSPTAFTRDEWFFIEWYWNHETDTLGICLNRGTEGTASFAGPFPASTNGTSVTFGNGYDQNGYNEDFAAEQFAFIRGAIPSAENRDWIYNSGAGRTLEDWRRRQLRTPIIEVTGGGSAGTPAFAHIG
jgi:hypothetical protein